jgi:hypothetical protein
MNARPQFADPIKDIARLSDKHEDMLLDMIDNRLRIAVEVRTTHKGLVESITEVRNLIAIVRGGNA